MVILLARESLAVESVSVSKEELPSSGRVVAGVVAVSVTPPASDGWCGKSAQVIIEQHASVAVLVVAGLVPAFGSNVFIPKLEVTVDGKVVASQAVGPGSFEIRAIVVGELGPRNVHLAFSDVRSLPAPDTRQVAARITDIEFITPGGVTAWHPTTRGGQEGATADIIRSDIPVALGRGWQPFETYQGESFRWAGPDVEFGVRPGTEMRLIFEAEPGAAVAGRPCILSLSDAKGRLIDRVQIEQRGFFEVLLPALSPADQPIYGRIEGPFAVNQGDPRILCLRFFSIDQHR